MSKNNFVSRLREQDFLEFAISAKIITKNYRIFKLSVEDDGEVSVTYKRKLTFSRNKNEDNKYITIDYNDFGYFNRTTWCQPPEIIAHLWRVYVAKRLGEDYIVAYERWKNGEIEEKRKKVDNLEKKYNDEVAKLRNKVDNLEKKYNDEVVELRNAFLKQEKEVL